MAKNKKWWEYLQANPEDSPGAIMAQERLDAGDIEGARMVASEHGKALSAMGKVGAYAIGSYFLPGLTPFITLMAEDAANLRHAASTPNKSRPASFVRTYEDLNNPSKTPGDKLNSVVDTAITTVAGANLLKQFYNYMRPLGWGGVKTASKVIAPMMAATTAISLSDIPEKHPLATEAGFQAMSYLPMVAALQPFYRNGVTKLASKFRSPKTNHVTVVDATKGTPKYRGSTSLGQSTPKKDMWDRLGAYPHLQEDSYIRVNTNDGFTQFKATDPNQWFRWYTSPAPSRANLLTNNINK